MKSVDVLERPVGRGAVVDFSQVEPQLANYPPALRQRARDAIFAVSERARDMILYIAPGTAFCRSECEAGFRITYTSTADCFTPMDISTTHSPHDEIREAFVVLRSRSVHEIRCLGRGNRPLSMLEPDDAATAAAPDAILGSITVGMGDLMVTGGPDYDTIADSTTSGPIAMGAGITGSTTVFAGLAGALTLCGAAHSGDLIVGVTGSDTVLAVMDPIRNAMDHLGQASVATSAALVRNDTIFAGLAGTLTLCGGAPGGFIGGGTSAVFAGSAGTLCAGANSGDLIVGGAGSVAVFVGSTGTLCAGANGGDLTVGVVGGTDGITVSAGAGAILVGDVPDSGVSHREDRPQLELRLASIKRTLRDRPTSWSADRAACRPQAGAHGEMFADGAGSGSVMLDAGAKWVVQRRRCIAAASGAAVAASWLPSNVADGMPARMGRETEMHTVTLAAALGGSGLLARTSDGVTAW